MKSELLNLYNDELANIKKEAAAFAKNNPRIANSLSLRQNAINDPLIAHLIESFSFVSARIKQQVTDEHELFSQAVLQELYPQSVRPRPAVSILQFATSDNNQSTISIPKHCELSGKDEFEKCRYQTVYDTTLLPLEISNISLKRWIESPQYRHGETIPQSCLKIDFRINDSVDLQKLHLNDFRLYLNTDSQFTAELYELLHNQFRYATFTQQDESTLFKQFEIKPVGFKDNESLNNAQSYQNNALDLISDYFYFPNKFHFTDVQLNQSLTHADRDFSFELYFDSFPAELSQQIDSQSLLLNCSPLINLFKTTAEPIQINSEQYEYPVKIDPYQSANSYSVHSIDSVSLITQDGQRVSVEPYLNSTSIENQTPYYWHTRWEKFPIDDHEGRQDECILTILDDNGEITQLENATLLIEANVTNHNVPQQMNCHDHVLQFWNQDYSSNCEPNVLYSFSKVKPMIKNNKQTWDLIKHLKIDHAPLGNLNNPITWLNNITALYSHNDNYTPYLFNSIDTIHTQNTVKSIQDSNGVGYLHGTMVTIKLKQDSTEYKDLYLFISILAHYFKHTSMINSFTETQLLNYNGDLLAQWDSTTGHKTLL
jgi:type VI secretion system protein ImpG